MPPVKLPIPVLSANQEFIHLAEKSLALIGNASGQGAEGATNCSEAFPIKANDFSDTWFPVVAAKRTPHHLSTSGGRVQGREQGFSVTPSRSSHIYSPF